MTPEPKTVHPKNHRSDCPDHNFKCEDCGQHFSITNGRKDAYQHAKSKKHRVSGQIELRYEYDFREENNVDGLFLAKVKRKEEVL